MLPKPEKTMRRSSATPSLLESRAHQMSGEAAAKMPSRHATTEVTHESPSRKTVLDSKRPSLLASLRQRMRESFSCRRSE